MNVLFEGARAGARDSGHDGVFFFVGVDRARRVEVVGEGGVGGDCCFCFFDALGVCGGCGGEGGSTLLLGLVLFLVLSQEDVVG